MLRQLVTLLGLEGIRLGLGIGQLGVELADLQRRG